MVWNIRKRRLESQADQVALAGLGIYKRKNENTQERKHASVHENTHLYEKAINNRNRPIKMIYVKI